MLKADKFRFWVAPFILFLMLAMTANALAATLDVDRVTQAKTNWCWAASSEMIGTYHNSSSSRTQWDIVKYIKGSSYPNEGGTTSDITKGIKYVSMDTVTYQSGSVASWSTHTTQISNGNPIAVWVDWTNGGAHLVVCAGTKTTSGTDYLYIIDPWEDNASEWYSYTAMKNGANIQAGHGKYTKSFTKS